MNLSPRALDDVMRAAQRLLDAESAPARSDHMVALVGTVGQIAQRAYEDGLRAGTPGLEPRGPETRAVELPTGYIVLWPTDEHAPPSGWAVHAPGVLCRTADGAEECTHLLVEPEPPVPPEPPWWVEFYRLLKGER